MTEYWRCWNCASFSSMERLIKANYYCPECDIGDYSDDANMDFGILIKKGVRS